MSENTPQWLQNLSLTDAFLWDTAFTTTFQELFKLITYHDSHWVASFTNEYVEHILIIRLDAFWNQPYTGYTERNPDWPFSIIKMEQIQSINYKKYDDCESPTISTSASELVDGIAITQFDDVCGGWVEFVHDPVIKVLLINAEGVYLDPVPIQHT